MGQYLTKTEESSLNYVDLPDTVHRKIFEYLNPWEIFKLSRISKAIHVTILKNKKFAVKDIDLCTDENILKFQFQFVNNIVLSWEFYNLHEKPYFTSQFSNRCQYRQQYDIKNYYENPEEAFLFAFRNALSIFNVQNSKLKRFYLAPSKLELFFKLPYSFIDGRNCENLSIWNKKANDEDERDFSINFAKAVLEKMGVVRNLRLLFNCSTKDNEFDCEKEYYNSETDKLMPNDWYLYNKFDDIDLNVFLKNWLNFRDPLIRKFRIRGKRNFNTAIIFDGIETIPWDQRNGLNVYYYSATANDTGSLIFQANENHAIVKVGAINGNESSGYMEFLFITF
ncbi:putative F-box protein C05B5.5 [Caenorhabditis elegans]|uniref:Uncharacterized F-box protein C05B5.5 n=1 Tax=Caenorhabditis elegans TaxID=6239 RepID=YKO5_CAEEL|nr:putative F-box protein C05B5.5 [Caenorhabditis elegans]P34293.5 RecName: Full=Uncharacterized F-box protein C05B5.5 [Caenorhabditis elegans]CAA83593.3 Uncharacterized F-box protein C05B5.5 [Caenorhabditis elegans]|eukprot:NP_499219.3 Uncharacterized F-box protein C05B5.5 [Caenorhabditis elegans]